MTLLTRVLTKAALWSAKHSSKPTNLAALQRAAERVELAAEDRLRKVRSESQRAPNRPNGSLPAEAIGCWIQNTNSPWLQCRPRSVDIPGMLTQEEIQYYNYVGRSYLGKGSAVELGPWLGLSTHHILAGLSTNPHFDDSKLHVYDDFVWRKDWMDAYVPSEDRAQHSDFLDLFHRYTAPIEQRLTVSKAKLSDYDGNENLPRASWNGGPIELMYIDCGRNIAANQAWWDIFSPYFIPGITLLIMQDWRVHRERPRKWYNQTQAFTELLGDRLRLIHELRDGGVGTFLFQR